MKWLIGKYNIEEDKIEPRSKEDIPSLAEVIKKVQYGPGPGFKREDIPFREEEQDVKMSGV